MRYTQLFISYIILLFFQIVKLSGFFCTRSQVFLYIFDTLTTKPAVFKQRHNRIQILRGSKKLAFSAAPCKKNPHNRPVDPQKTDSDTAEQTCQKAGGVKSLLCFVLPTSRPKSGRPAYPHKKSKSLNQGVGFIQKPCRNALRRNFCQILSAVFSEISPRKECRNRKDPHCPLLLRKV